MLKQSVRIFASMMLIVGAAFHFIGFRRQRFTRLLSMVAIVMLVHFNIGIMLLLPVIYMASDSLIKKRRQVYCLLILSTIGILIKLSLLKYVAGFYWLLSLYNYYKGGGEKALKGQTLLAILLCAASLNIEFSVFKLFYQELFLLAIAGYLIVERFFQFRQLLSREQMVKVDRLRGVTHDLKLPIATISLNTDLLLSSDFDSELKKEQSLQIIKSSLEDLTYMINSLSIYTSSDHFVNDKFQSSMQDAIHQTIKHFQYNAKHIVIHTSLCQEECYLPIEEIWLNRLVYNLVDNAFKYTDEYGEIEIVLQKEKRTVCLSVKDNGIGMAPESLQKIWEPFYRVDTARQNSGMGLGLSIVKSIVDALGGEVRIESELGEYTHFEIRI
ncbi:HAMP domain-containing histidine kinase [Fusibacter paucivorans]|uniref:histidine kinase n=1 Tax=Fusibacter paucivorans TaxID=76009 RepID=A0ABS5PLI8_9FIRM|nr:HAMP domain-containing histidine kinase [Fusibacter paucivorans]